MRPGLSVMRGSPAPPGRSPPHAAAERLGKVQHLSLRTNFNHYLQRTSFNETFCLDNLVMLRRVESRGCKHNHKRVPKDLTVRAAPGAKSGIVIVHQPRKEEAPRCA